jgi:hypothetical protein
MPNGALKVPLYGSNLYGSFYIKQVNGALYGVEYFIQANSGGSGLYKSVDNGMSWKRQVCPGLNIIDIEIQNNVLIIGTNKGIYRSNDNGVNWLSSNAGMTQQDSTRAYKLIKINNNSILAYGTRLYYSVDNGITWINSPMVNSSSYFQCLNKTNILYAATTSGIKISADNALTWFQSNSGLGSDTLLKDIIEFNNDLYCIADNSKIYKSVDNGANWILSYPGVSNVQLSNLFNVNNKLYVTTPYNTFEYDQTTGLWLQSIINQSENIMLRGYANGNYFGSNLYHDALIRSSNNGLNWISVNDSIMRMNINKLNTDNSLITYTAYGAYEYDSLQNTYIRITPYNTNYSSNTYIQYGVFDIKKSTNGNIYIGTAGGVWKSTNNGLSYNQFYNGIPASGATQTRNVYDMYISGAAPNDTLFAATDGGIYMSLDGAQNFTLVNGTNGNKMQQFLKYQGVLYCAGTKIYKQTTGNAWNQFTTFTNTGILGFAAADNNLFVATSNSPIKYANVNGLSNFTNIITSALGTYNAVSVAVYDTLVFFRNQNGVFKLNTSTLGSAQTTDIIDISGNLPFYFNPGNVRQYSYLNNGFGMAVFNGKLWLGTNGMSTFYRSLNDFGYNITVGENNESKTKVKKLGFFPNPAKESIRINFISVQDQKDVMVSITDIRFYSSFPSASSSF